MKKVFFILWAVFFLFFLSAILINPAIIFLVERQLGAICKGSEVSIGSCRLNLTRQLSFADVRIKNQAYDFLVKEAKAQYSLSSIFKGEILRFSLKDAKIYINLPQKNIAEFSQYFNLGSKKVFLVKSLELSDFNLDLKAKDFHVNGVLSSRVNLVEQIVDSLDIKIGSLGIQGFNLSNVSLRAAQDSSRGYFGINRMECGKLNISEIKSKVRFFKKELFLEGMSAGVLDGNISGNLKFNIDQNMSYEAILKFTNLDIARFIDDFDLKKKFEMTGRLEGTLVFKGRGADIEILSAELSSLQPGGILMIKDAKFLENMARSSNQSLDLLVENFQNYHYNIGTIKLFLDKGDLILDAALEGETGKRDLNIVLHDFSLKKEGQ